MDLDALELRFRDVALVYPESDEQFPWGERVIKVKGKIFLFLSRAEDHLSVGVKLPASHVFALEVFDWAAPSGYGLGKSGWVTLKLQDSSDADPELIERWIDESYRAVAPKKLAKLLPEPA